MTAEIIAQVLDSGGQIAVDGADLVLTAPRPLPDDLLAQIRKHKRSILDALARPDPLPPAAEGRRRKVLAMARDGKRYAILVEDPSTDPVTTTLATPNATGELLIPRDRYEPFAVLATVQGWEA